MPPVKLIGILLRYNVLAFLFTTNHVWICKKNIKMTEDAKKLFPRRVTTSLKLLSPLPKQKKYAKLFICKMAV